MSFFNQVVRGDQMVEGIYKNIMTQVIRYVDSKHKTEEVTEDSVLHNKVQSDIALQKINQYIGDGASNSEKVAKKIKAYILEHNKIIPKNTSTETM